jgi:hypothetical protein
MSQQNYSNHRRWVPMYHFVSSLLIYAAFIGSIVNLIKTMNRDTSLYDASLLVVVTFVAVVLHYYVRVFALKAQDRAIRAEENLRHYVLTGKLLDPSLTVRQIIGLRFAVDDEFVELAKRAADEQLSEVDIKKAIANWRADTYRV